MKTTAASKLAKGGGTPTHSINQFLPQALQSKFPSFRPNPRDDSNWFLHIQTNALGLKLSNFNGAVVVLAIDASCSQAGGKNKGYVVQVCNPEEYGAQSFTLTSSGYIHCAEITGCIHVSNMRHEFYFHASGASVTNEMRLLSSIAHWAATATSLEPLILPHGLETMLGSSEKMMTSWDDVCVTCEFELFQPTTWWEDKLHNAGIPCSSITFVDDCPFTHWDEVMM